MKLSKIVMWSIGVVLTLSFVLTCNNSDEDSSSLTLTRDGTQPHDAISVEANNRSYDPDDDGLIEILYIEQLDAVRHDLNGDGIPDNPDDNGAYYEAFDRTALEAACAEPCGGYELARDLDFKDPDSYVSGTDRGWLPVGANRSRFSAEFEGNGHTISNLNTRGIKHELPHFSVAGLFGWAGMDSVIRNVGLRNANVKGENNVGGLVGRNEGEIINSYVTGKVNGKDNVGGLTGINNGVVRFSYAVVTVSGEKSVGGVVGWSHKESDHKACAVEFSYASGDVSGDLEVGGLVGRNEEGLIVSTYAMGNVTGESSVGGLVGVNEYDFYPSNVIASYATGNVMGDSVVGGLAGGNSGSIVASYATGGVSGTRVIGGLIGDNSMPWVDRRDEGGPGTVISSYATGGVTGESVVGGLAGRNPGRIISSFWDINTSAQNNGAGEGNPPVEPGKTTTEMQSPTGFNGIYDIWNIDLDNADGDFTLETGSGDFWDFGTGSQYPALVADFDENGVPTWKEFGNQGRDPSLATAPASLTLMPTPAPTPSSQDGVNLDSDSDGLIEISNLEQLNAIRYDLDGDGSPDDDGAAIYALAFHAPATGACDQCTGYELTRPLDFQVSDSYASGMPNPLWMTGSGWLPIGIEEIENTFNATLEGNGYTISNLYIHRTTILDDAGATGLFGYTGPDSIIRGVKLGDVNIVGGRDVGSLVGINGGTVSGSYASGNISGNFHTGGLVGWHLPLCNEDSECPIAFSFSEANVNGTHYVGGLVGYSHGLVNASHANGTTKGDRSVGGLIGGNVSTVRTSYATGQVSGRESVGGLAGWNSGIVETSYANAGVAGVKSVGGLVGDNNRNVLASYSAGSVAGKRFVGGLVGWNGGAESPAAIINCLATASVVGEEKVGGLVGRIRGAVIESFWDTEATGELAGAGESDPSNEAHFPLPWWDGEVQVIGKTTSELQEPTDYSGIYAGWKQLLEGVRYYGYPITEDIAKAWDFGTSSQYPALKVDFNGDGQSGWEEFGNQPRDLSQSSSQAPVIPTFDDRDEEGFNPLLVSIAAGVSAALAIGAAAAIFFMRRR